jgi:8-oxo-dGTP pyrophosphatase MutT (NUDIX family)
MSHILISPPKNGALVIPKVGDDIGLYQKIKLVVDADDRGRGTGIRMMGLPGGGIEEGETPEETALRECEEEAGFFPQKLEYFGCFTKMRGPGVQNLNHIFCVHAPSTELETNDPNEVFQIVTFSLGEILNLGLLGEVHEGTLRILLNYLSNKRSGSLSEKAYFLEYVF